jgi:hypothetical protein
MSKLEGLPNFTTEDFRAIWMTLSSKCHQLLKMDSVKHGSIVNNLGEKKLVYF